MKLNDVVDSVKLKIKSNYYLFRLFRFPGGLLSYYKQKVNVSLDNLWEDRIKSVLQSPDNSSIKRVKEAGAIQMDTQIMHNGIKINVGSYYGDANTVLLFKNKGVHEPAEEKAFNEILSHIPENASMLELGSFWAFYSMTFLKNIQGGRSYLIEPDKHALLSGMNNFRLNGFKGNFFNYYISNISENGKVPTITIADFLRQQKVSRLNILHSDIQGFELKMLEGAGESLRDGKIDYLFISTHSNELHSDCMAYLIAKNYDILCDANLDQSYSWDGLIVAKHKSIKEPSKIEISRRK